MPNSAVKPLSADGSVGPPHARVGHRQAFIQKNPNSPLFGFFITHGSARFFHVGPLRGPAPRRLGAFERPRGSAAKSGALSPPCESRSSSGIYSKNPSLIRGWGFFFYGSMDFSISASWLKWFFSLGRWHDHW